MICDGTLQESIKKAAELLLNDDVVAFPTETVYGLGATCFSARAVKKIFHLKHRPAEDPLIVHVSRLSQVNELTLPLTAPQQILFSKLTSVFWPGPLTLVLRKNKKVPSEVSGGLDTVGIRMPRHPVALALIEAAKIPLAAPSANRFQSISPTTAQAVYDELGTNVSLILDGGPCEVGLESTVLSLVDEEPVILRLGGVPQEEIERILNRPVKSVMGAVASAEQPGVALPAPGMLEFHYAPQKPLKFCSTDQLKRILHEQKNGAMNPQESALLCFSEEQKELFKDVPFKVVEVLSLAGDLQEAARKLFQKMRELDHGPSKMIFALECPDKELGRAMNDRMRKAQHGDTK